MIHRAHHFCVAVALLSVIAPVWSDQVVAEVVPVQRSITISASAVVMAEPDQAEISAGVASEAKTAAEALARNTTAMSKVIEELKSAGIEAKDIQTSSFAVEPLTMYPKEGDPPVISGYRVNNQVGVRVRDLGALGTVLDKLVSAGANDIGALSFVVSRAETLKDEARSAAVANAARRANLLAAAAGAELGDVVSISEDSSSQPPMPMFRHKAAAMSAGAAPIERGTSALEARVTITWSLR